MLYKTKASNQDGIHGRLIFSDNEAILTKHPLEDGPGYNPEQLVASAWATCLNATIQALLEARGQQLKSKVEIEVTLCREKNEPGYYFQVDAQAAIDQLSLEDAEVIIAQAHLRCPVSKLLVGAKTLTLKTVVYNE